MEEVRDVGIGIIFPVANCPYLAAALGDLHQDPRITLARKQMDRLEDRTLATVIRPDEQIDPRQAVELVVFKGSIALEMK